MMKRFGLPMLVLAATLFLSPNLAQARDRDGEHHRHRISVFFGFGPRHYSDGYYDRWGYWHPAVPGYYDRWGYWHRY